ncbi:allophanate hydrolase subunit 1 [Paraburkholderia sp. BL21I4N1]|uniref:5-oxoprolinase subunit B family protein n=1 Tax=Paraburkholderia sp. BL21I4N1 TaxID=1938801 RepID=UPI000CFCB740|nr:allophanate hydrolase subunit 1 [Paraburkholderia sp. BL21I4N1]PQV43541.1 KipI family sensor histidine kinase inhibitor [Paraburkholderia sp. BL21I4N1]
MTTVDQLDRRDVDLELIQPPDSSIRISHAGVGGLLLDPSHSEFDTDIQSRLLWLAERLRATDMRARGVRQAILGVNNLLVLFDSSNMEPRVARELAEALWKCAESTEGSSKTVEFDVDYGGEGGPDLVPTAEALGMTVADLIRKHSEATYTVACIGSMPGFPYMTGLPGDLQTKRRANPRVSLSRGSVIIAGAQASVLPMTAPCGWHALGRTDASLFDPYSPTPCLLGSCDTVRFNVRRVLS